MRYNCRMVAPDRKAAFLIQMHFENNPDSQHKGFILRIPISKEKI